jgi:hypothetical protein
MGRIITKVMRAKSAPNAMFSAKLQPCGPRDMIHKNVVNHTLLKAASINHQGWCCDLQDHRRPLN